MGELVSLGEFRRKSRRKRSCVHFSRPELNRLLSIYSRRVISGEWKAYAIDHRDGVALFSVFEHAKARPIYTVAKFADNSHRDGDYLITSAGRRIRRGKDLSEIVSVFEPKLKLVSN